MMFKTIVIGSGLAIASQAWSTEGLDRYKQAHSLLEKAPQSIQDVRQNAPKFYEFKSRFDQNSSVSYAGQTFRQVLINDMKTFVDQLGRGTYPGSVDEAHEALESFYSYSYANDSYAPGAIHGFVPFSIKVYNLDGQLAIASEGEVYEDLQEEGKQLRDKTAGNDNSLRRGELKGWETLEFHGLNLRDIGKAGVAEPADLISAWMQTLAVNAVDGDDFVVPNGNLPAQRVSAAYVTEEGWDLAQLLQKFLHGAVAFSQAAEDYLLLEGQIGKGLLADNSSLAKAGVNYTALEHGWDEAFGYFGAARDYLSYSPRQISSGFSRDTNEDGMISILTEKNMGLSLNAARRDLGAVSGSTNMAAGAMGAFLKGRALITERPEGYLPYAQAEATLALAYWEQSIAATVIHYINRTELTLGQYGSNAYLFTNLAKFWSEMKGFALAFQFHPYSHVNDQDFDLLHRLMADRPVLPHQASQAEVNKYRADLIRARDILQKSFGFNPQDVQSW